jgi:propanol-preferring alcohol dehydrogenase
MSLQFANLAGAETAAVDRAEAQLSLARELGAEHALLSEQVEDFVRKEGKFDVVMVHAPSQKAVDQATRIVKRGGTILMAVLGQVEVIFPEEIEIIPSVIGSRQDMKDTLRIASTGKIKVKYTTYKLNEAEQVLTKLKKGQIIGRAVLTP